MRNFVKDLDKTSVRPKGRMDSSKFQPLIDHFGEKPPNAGQLLLLCLTTNRKELFMPAVAAFMFLVSKIDMMDEDKRKIVRRIEQRIEQFN